MYNFIQIIDHGIKFKKQTQKIFNREGEDDGEEEKESSKTKQKITPG